MSFMPPTCPRVVGRSLFFNRSWLRRAPQGPAVSHRATNRGARRPRLGRARRTSHPSRWGIHRTRKRAEEFSEVLAQAVKRKRSQRPGMADRAGEEHSVDSAGEDFSCRRSLSAAFEEGNIGGGAGAYHRVCTNQQGDQGENEERTLPRRSFQASSPPASKDARREVCEYSQAGPSPASNASHAVIEGKQVVCHCGPRIFERALNAYWNRV